MSKTNPSREIAFIFALAVAFAAGLYAYISSSIERPKPSVLVATPIDATALPDNRPDDARRVAGVFVQHLAAGRYDDAYLTMARAYRQTTPLSAFRAACAASPFLSGAQSVSISRTRQERAAGQQGSGSLSGSGVLITKSGTVDVTFWFVDDAAGVAILSLNVAGTPALPLGTTTPSAPTDAGSTGKKR